MNNNVKIKALLHAFPATIPVLLGYLFIGFAFGVLLAKAGYGAVWGLLMSALIYAGSMQFAAISFLSGGFSLISVILITLMINGRHIFYGLTMTDRFRGIKNPKKLYMIFALTDETYALYCSGKIPEGVEADWYLFFIALLDQLYWIIGTLLGSAASSVLSFDSRGIEFAMTGLFIVILIEQLKASRVYAAAAIGAVCSVVSLAVFGGGAFILPSMTAITLLLAMLKGPLENRRLGGGGK